MIRSRRDSFAVSFSRRASSASTSRCPAVELRGGPRVQKMTTFTQNVENYQMEWGQEIRMELTDASKELRILLCKEKPKDQTKKTTPVVAACGESALSPIDCCLEGVVGRWQEFL